MGDLEELIQLEAYELDEVITSVYGVRENKAREEVEAAEGEIYAPESKTFIKETYAAKVNQRAELRDRLPEHDWILELFAGRGALTEKVYAGYCNKLWLVDADNANLQVARSRLEGFTYEAFFMDNLKWLKNYLRFKVEAFQEHLTLVDFDAFGMPGRQIQRFFELFRIQRPLCVAITDGGSRRLGFNSKELSKILSRHYMMDKKFTRGDQVFFVNQLMDEIARGQNCKCIRVNSAQNPQKTVVYAGYVLTPEV
jgi:hypothetical protein